MASLRVKEVLCLLYSGLLLVSGVLMVGFSVVCLFKLVYHFKFVPSNCVGPFVIYFSLGFVHLFLTWLGVKGPTREHDVHIILFIVITLLLLIAECAVGVWSIILWNEVDGESLQLMTKSFDELLNNDYNKKDWARLESELKCCGFDGPRAYEKKKFLPLSCCNKELQNATCTEILQVGCQRPLAGYVKAVLVDGTVMGFSCCVFQAVGVLTFCTFFRALKRDRAARAQRRLALQRGLSEQSGGGVAPTPSSPPPTAPS